MPRFILIFAATLGLAVVVRAAALYRGTDSLAFSLVLAIGAGLLLGLFELWGRAQRAELMRRHLRDLPRPASLEAIQAAPEPLRNWLEVRISGAPIAVRQASLAVYLLGMLVTLGMLGTFLGLFESLRGAREALTAGGDVDALRSGLAAPMVGLSRAFGTSATGVSASALLGLAMVFTRREEGKLSAELAAYASGPMMPLSLQGRMLAALEKVASSTSELPKTTAAMESALSRMDRIEDEASRERRETSERVAELSRALLAELRTSFSSLSQETRAAFEDAVAKASLAASSLSETTAETIRETSQRQLELLRSGQENLTKSFREAAEEQLRLMRAVEERAATTLGEASSEQLRLMRSGQEEANLALQKMAEAASSALTSSMEGVKETASRAGAEAVVAMQAAQRETSSSLRALGEEISASLRALHEQSSLSLEKASAETAQALQETSREQLEASKLSIEEASAAMREAAERGEGALLRASEQILELVSSASADASLSMKEGAEAVRQALSTALDDAAKGAVLAISPIAEEATERAAQVATEHLSRFLERLEADRGERRLSEEEVAERLAELVESVASGAGELHEKMGEQSMKLEALAREVREQTERVSSASEARVAEIAEQAREALDERLRSLLELDESLSKMRNELGGALVAKIEEHAGELREKTAETATLAKDAAELLRTGGAEISAAAELLTAAIDRHREASERWLDGVALGGEASSGSSVMGEQIDASLDKTREALSHVVELQREMITEIRALRPAEEIEGAADEAEAG